MSDEKKRSKSKDDKEKEDDGPRRGSSEPTDPGLAEWILKLWKNNEVPQFIYVTQIFSKGRVRGTEVDRESFTVNTPMDMERAVDLANQFITAAQLDCDKIIRKRQAYYVYAYSKSRGAEPFRSYPLDLHPRSAYLTLGDSDSRPGGGDDDDDGDGDGAFANPKALAFRYTKMLVEAGQWDKAHYAKTFGDLFVVQQSLIGQLSTRLNESLIRERELFRQVEDAASTALDREIARKWAQLKIELAQDGVRTARNFLPGLMAAATERPNTGKSEEQIMVDNFLHDCKATGIDVKLFGEWSQEGDTMKPVKSGIFTPVQFAVLVKVSDGQLPPEALDDLMPGSGKPNEISMSQLAEAQPLMTEGTGTTLMELVGLRRRKLAQKQNTTTTATTNG